LFIGVPVQVTGGSRKLNQIAPAACYSRNLSWTRFSEGTYLIMKTTLSIVTSALLVTAALAQQTIVEERVRKAPVTVTETVEKTSTFTGNVASVDPQLSTISMSTEGSAAPVSYVFTETTKFIDAEGQPMTHEALAQGQPATITYVKAGDRLVVLKAVALRPAATTVIESRPVAVEEKVVVTPAAPVVEERTVVQQPKLIEEKKTTTTTTTVEE
jgi:hypothetical protein